ncbi:hypothetical protein MPSEU_000134300 [Mayamaea pseudoterrestris]|nr:hypothetical protein MPSEU_000134300 [Mayamaea pseudoterrestris]
MKSLKDNEGAPATAISPNTVAGFGDSPEVFPLLPKQMQWTTRKASSKSIRTSNPIRAIVDPIVKSIRSGEERGDGKNHISLALGDPTAAGNLPPCPVAIEAVNAALHSPLHAAGYVNACGLPTAREAIAAYHSSNHHIVHADQVIVACGCSGALELALTALLDTDSILLVPQPGFPLYQVIAESHGAKSIHYRLKADSSWECDLEHMQDLVDEHGSRISGVLVNNPSNPTGSVFSLKHLQDIVTFCQENQLPIVADEVYGDITFAGHAFHPMANVAAAMGRHVPVITASGIGKQFLLPGWRVGWIVFQDNIFHSMRDVEDGAKRLAQVVLGASHLAQVAVPALLDPFNDRLLSWKTGLRGLLESQANFVCAKLGTVPGLEVINPGGAMYALVRMDSSVFDETIPDDIAFSQALMLEENVFVLPGSCFGVENVFRIVFCAPIVVLDEATERIQTFCHRHSSLG